MRIQVDRERCVVDVIGAIATQRAEPRVWFAWAGILHSALQPEDRGTAAGGGYSTVADLLRFAQALQSGRLLSKEMFATATAPQNLAGHYGYGFGVYGSGQTHFYGHGGGAPGMNAELRVYPKLGYVLIALSNLDPPAASMLVDYYAARMPVQ